MLDKPLRRTLGAAVGLVGPDAHRHLVASFAAPQWPNCRQVLAERPCRRQLQRLLHEIIRVFSIPDPPSLPTAAAGYGRLITA